METPETCYAETPRGAVAWQQLGSGPFDLVFVPGFISHLDVWWHDRASSRFVRRLARFARLILFDKLGTGLSDPLEGGTPFEERIDEIAAVMEAAQAERPALIGTSEGGMLAAVFAATRPEQVRSLVLLNSTIRFGADAGWPGWPPDLAVALRDSVRRADGAELLTRWAPSLTGSEEAARAFTRIVRMSASPKMTARIIETVAQSDARAVAPLIAAPTLVIHADQDRMILPECGRATAALIPGARYVTYRSRDHLPWLEGTDEMLDEVERFLTGARPAPAIERTLATILFADIVDSTTRAAAVGDERWRRVLEDFDVRSSEVVERWRGRVVKTLGDGFLATFDGPGRGVHAAREVVEEARALDLELRCGLHTGECEVVRDDVAGLAVHIGARVAGLAGAGEVLATGTVKDLTAGAGIDWEDRGEVELRGVPGSWRIQAVA